MRNNGGARFGFNNADDEGEREQEEQGGRRRKVKSRRVQFSDYFVKKKQINFFSGWCLDV